MDPATLSAAAIATLVITKAFEKTGEKLGEKALEQGGKLVRLIRERFPSTATVLARVEEQPEDWGEAVLEVEAAAKKDNEVKATVEAIADEVKSQPTFNQMIKNIVKNNYGGNVGNVQNDNRTQTFNF
jgi:vacuolar-type H+-ATPase subunit C/Vma6